MTPPAADAAAELHAALAAEFDALRNTLAYLLAREFTLAPDAMRALHGWLAEGFHASQPQPQQLDRYLALLADATDKIFTRAEVIRLALATKS